MGNSIPSVGVISLLASIWSAQTVLHVDDDAPKGPALGHNTVSDPLFVQPGDGKLRLSPGSPCTDAWLNFALPADVNGDGVVDFEGVNAGAMHSGPCSCCFPAAKEVWRCSAGVS
jgi:hypothetical protein